MEKFYEITDDEKWNALVNCNKNYDGLFFYGVKTTGIFCRPSCNSKTPSRRNVTFLKSRNDAIKEGFRACKRCCPDKEIFNPDIELVEKAKKLLLLNFNKRIDLNYISKELGVSINNLRRIFKRVCGKTLMQYIVELRIKKSVELLKNTDLDILDIAYKSGFNSLSNFYKCFKEEIRKSPIKYRNNLRRKSGGKYEGK